MIYALHVNLYALIILLIVLVSLRKHKDLKSMNNRYFILALIHTSVALAADMMSVIFNGKPGQLIFLSNNFFNMILYTMGVCISFYWVLFVDHHIFKNNAHIKKIMPILVVPVIANIILSILSMFFNIYFHINATNTYERGTYYLFNFGINYAYIVYSVYLIIRYHKMIKKKDLIPLLMFPLLPFLGSIIQILNYGVLLIWPMAALSLMIIFIFIQSRLINIDALTELNNKREFNDFVMTQAKNNDQKKMIGGIFIDIDDFKKINDVLGHAVGDMVLKEFANILRKSFGFDDFIARIGGDEFVVVIEFEKQSEFFDSIETLKRNIQLFNASKVFDIEIQASFGYDIYDVNKYNNFENFVISLDQQMYRHKKV
ncbi:MAG: GGDEF domain-containing protein [Acholeplasmataceae bacterium]|nr:GGDEF domain-containing protein [Acholeplasmataceae bacterium]